MKIDKTIAEALHQAADYYGSNAEIAKKAQMHAATIGQYRNGRILHVSDNTWERLYEVISRWLPADPAYYPKSMFAKGTHKNAVRYDTRIPPDLRTLVEAWPHLCHTQQAKILGYVEGILDAGENKGEAKAG